MKKGDKTKELIITNSTKLFAQKGYPSVTMKDICHACSLSRGGLYRHFGSTKEIFVAMLEKDMDDGRNVVEENVAKGVPALLIFDNYLKGEKEAILNENHGLYFAIHEFAFYEKDTREYFNNRNIQTQEIIKSILEHGQKNGELKEFDVKAMSAHIVYFMDSLKTSSSIFNITEEFLDKQLKLIKEMIT